MKLAWYFQFYYKNAHTKIVIVISWLYLHSVLVLEQPSLLLPSQQVPNKGKDIFKEEIIRICKNKCF